MRRFLTTAASAVQTAEVTLAAGGRLRGRVVEPPNEAPPFQAFMGIPFAAKPVGKLRYKPPQPHEGWSGVLDATKEADVCLQIDHMVSKLIGSEDCLYLNVYRPVDTDASHRKPVVVYIHYGLYTLSNPGQASIGPEFIVGKDIIMVVIHYRIMSLGFLSLNSPACPGNNGIKDCIAGLRWVRDNIASFGGDPEQVTLFGFCVGAVICHALQFVDTCKDLFNKSIIISGSSACSWYGYFPGEVVRSRALDLVRRLGINYGGDDEELMERMREAPVGDLFTHTMNIVLEGDPPMDRANPAFFPVIDGPILAGSGSSEEVTMPDNPIRLLRDHRFNAKPTLFGVTREDGQVVRCNEKVWAGTRATEENLSGFDERLERILPWDLDLTPAERRELTLDVRRMYFGGVDNKPTLFQYYEIMNDMAVMKGMIEAARYHATHPSRPPTYLWCFSVEAKNNRSKIRYNLPSGIVAHMDDMGYYFGCRDTPPGPEPRWPADSLEALTRRRMTAILANFIKRGDPTPEDEPEPELRGVRWPRLPTTLTEPYPYINIGHHFSLGYELHGARMRFWQSVYDKHFTTGDTARAREWPTWNKA